MADTQREPTAHERTLLDPMTLAKLATLPLRARRVVEGVLTGLHRSPWQGQSVEFAEHKEYAPGDDVRRVDWRAFARVDKYYIKNYELETNLRAWVVVDASASMTYGRRGVTKLDYARVLAASLAHLLIRQQDACGLVVAGAPASGPAAAEDLVSLESGNDGPRAGVRAMMPPRASQAHLAALCDQLEATAPGGATSLADTLETVAEAAGRRALVFVVSDLFDPSPRGWQAVAKLRRHGSEVVFFHLLDRDELDFPFDEPTEFLSLETDERIEVHPGSVKRDYLAQLQAFCDETRRALVGQGAEYHLAPTDAPLDKVLVDFLAARRRTGRRL
ncbi:MAG: hypothetical protein RL199_288 [Pseudomonadota bacterium]